jgi:hypothetical protein
VGHLFEWAFLALESGAHPFKFLPYRNDREITRPEETLMSKPSKELRARYLATRDVGERYANAAPKTVREWEEKGIIPKADLTINGHKYWLEESLDRHDHQRVIDGTDRRPAGQFDGKRNKRSVAAE